MQQVEGSRSLIASLDPSMRGWCIRARVIHISDMQHYSNDTGPGKFFKVIFLDDSGEICCSGFNQQADRYFNVLRVDEVYQISNARLQKTNPKYATVKNKYEMRMDRATRIDICRDDDTVPFMTFDFVKISELEKCKPDSLVDVIGVVKECHDVVTLPAKQSKKENKKRDLQIVDGSKMAVNLTLWGETAVTFNGKNCPVVAVKRARVSSYEGKSLSVGVESPLRVNPNWKKANVLRRWFDDGGKDLVFGTFEKEKNWKTFEQVKSENLGHKEKPDHYTVKGILSEIKKNSCVYKACPKCKKKLNEQENGRYHCEKCDKKYSDYKWNMILTAVVTDHSGEETITCFQKAAERILSIKADELGDVLDHDERRYHQIVTEAESKQHFFQMRVQPNTSYKENAVKTSCVSADPVNWQEYGKHLAGQLELWVC